MRPEIKPTLYPDESETVAVDPEDEDEVGELTESLDQVQNRIYADPDGPAQPPPPHPRHAAAVKDRKVMADSSTQGTSPEDALSWSTFDIGRAMTALRSGTPDIQRRILRRLHVRWWHATPTKMIGIVKQAGILGPVFELCKYVCNTCRICKDWIPPGNKPMAKTRMSTSFNDVIRADLRFWKKQNCIAHD